MYLLRCQWPHANKTANLLQYSNCLNVFRLCYSLLLLRFTYSTEPEFLKIFKCTLAESVSAGFQFNCFDIFNDKTLNYRYLDHFLGLLKFIQKNIFYQQTKATACINPVVLSDLWKDSSLRKVDFSASSKCYRIWALYCMKCIHCWYRIRYAMSSLLLTYLELISNILNKLNLIVQLGLDII